MLNLAKYPLIVAIAGSAALMFSALSNAAADDTPGTPVKVDIVTKMQLAATTHLMGTLHSRAHVDVTAGVSGSLKWLAEPGTQVKRGDTLVKTDLLPLELKQLEQKAQIKRAKINVKYLNNELQRLLTLRKSNATSQFQVDQARSQYEIALADIEISELKLAIIDDQIQRATLIAPFNAVVTQRLARAGTDVNRGDVLLKLLDTDNLEVRTFVPVKYLKFVRLRPELSLLINQQQISAKIVALIPSVDPLSQTFEVRIAVPAHLNESLAAGQLIQVTVPTQDTKSRLTIDRDALILRKEGTYVVRVDSDNTAHRIAVTVGTGNTDRVSIVGELSQGDRVAIRGAERLTEGQSVAVQ